MTQPQLQIPSSFFGTRKMYQHTDDSYFFERYLKQQNVIEEILDFSHFRGMVTVADFGCHVGGWSWVLSQLNQQVVALDVIDPVVNLAQEFAEYNGVNNINFGTVDGMVSRLTELDGILCVGTIQVMSTRDIYRFFEFAANSLKPGGLLLCNTANPNLVLEWLLTLKRVKYEGWKGQGFWLKMLMRAYRDRAINPDKDYYCLSMGAVINLASQYNLMLKVSPQAYKTFHATQEFEDINNGGQKSLLRHYDWFLFERQ
ncbi:class I SAM-dependent methyltransferase [bacterium]|nr:class I SAM-dependent methyltransferase [bacterium]